ncbi:hypothetical protein [Asanoa iriomotensis]|uniref:Sigma-70-like protein n=1 Tax=Asanoa iriomotensis TaxID=234613 RepID=A0ABQ4C6Y2_9ACTN|nr:hypothetical protein [Asanoa iriomotensis]GIF58060.1 hypothetical protein Air01nite_41550 [Asanoa iriomotensis]
MTDRTSKPRSTRKRAKQFTETTEFDAFARRILRAYGRRVSAGDVEALQSLADLASEVDAVTRLAVVSLRKPPYRYSWDEIGQRLGVTRQAAQARFGERPDRPGAMDARLVQAGQLVTVATLAEVFADHHPGRPARSVCPGCGFRYTDNITECPTLATARPLLYRRRAEDQKAIGRLTGDQLDYLIGTRSARKPGATARRTFNPNRPPEQGPPSLFPISVPGGA